MNWNFLFSNKSVHEQVTIFNQTIFFRIIYQTSWLQLMTKILHGWMKVLRRKLCPKSMHVNLLMLIRRTTMSTWNSRLYQQNYQKWYCKEEDYYCVLSDKLSDAHTSGKSYWSILKTLYNGIKIPLILPILINSKLISNFKEKANHFNAFFTS